MITTGAIFGYLVALAVGGILGVLGAGGAILAVPALVYLFEVPLRQATHLSLGVVGLVALLGSWQAYRARELNFAWAFRVFIPSSVGVFLSRRWLLPLIPASGDFLLVFAFAALMLLAARAMMTGTQKATPSQPAFLARALGVGVVTGMLGAGGGFLIVPMLSLWGGLAFRMAAGTSLLVVFLNSFVGFASGWSPQVYQWLPTLFGFVGISVVGLFFSRRFAASLPQEKLRRGFGLLLILVSLQMLIQQLFFRG